MADVNVLISALVKRFVDAASSVQHARFVMGDTILELWRLTGSKTRTLELLRDAVPDGRLVIGYAITKDRLEQLASAAATFKADGGFIGGDHCVSRDEVQALDLSPAEAARLASLASSGEVRAKTIKRAAQRVIKNPDGKGAESSKARIKAMVTNGNDSAPATESLGAKRDRLAKLTKRIGELKRERDTLAAEIAAAEAPVVPQVTRRRASKGKGAAAATATA